MGEHRTSDVPQPRPAPFDCQGLSEDDVLDFTAEPRQEALAILRNYDYGPFFTPPCEQKPTIVLPFSGGGASWSRAAFDPDAAWLRVPSVMLAFTITLFKPNPDHSRAHFAGRLKYLPGPRDLLLTKPLHGVYAFGRASWGAAKLVS